MGAAGAAPLVVLATSYAPPMPVAAPESCLRCGAVMEWRQQTWQCPRCRFKLGCCEGESGDCEPLPRPVEPPLRQS